jgi:hypothetical protein
MAGYLLLGERQDWHGAIAKGASSRVRGPLETIERTYPQRWLQEAYRAPAKVEQWLRGIEVQSKWIAAPPDSIPY